jgi:hypothetical protein
MLPISRVALRALSATLILSGLLQLPYGEVALLCLSLVTVGWLVVRPAVGALSLDFRGNIAVWSASRAGSTLAIAAVALIVLSGQHVHAEAPGAGGGGMVVSLDQTVTVNEAFATVDCVMLWDAEKGETLTFLEAPGVLTRLDESDRDFSLIREVDGENASYLLFAKRSGRLTIRFLYHLPVLESDMVSEIVLPTAAALLNEAVILIDRADLILASSEAVTIALEPGEEIGTTTARFAFTPVRGARLQWKPKKRETRFEIAIVFAESSHLFDPAAGVIEGIHIFDLRLAQGEVRKLSFHVPEGLTIVSVSAEMLVGWRFDPDSRSLEVNFDYPRTSEFSVEIRSQSESGGLPYLRRLGMVSVDGVVGEVGMVGIATGPEVQLGETHGAGMAPINIEDFPLGRFPGANDASGSQTLRRAFRFSDPTATLELETLAVEPLVRATVRQTLSLGEDQTVLATDLQTTITRAGVFALSFDLPHRFEVESITGPILSHWTESAAGEGTVVTLHTAGKVTGEHAFHINLVGPGVGSNRALRAPRLVLRESDKHRGVLLIVPEEGMRLGVVDRDGLTQVDPREAGVKRPGVQVFRLLRNDWSLGFEVEKIDPWIEVASLQDATIREGLIEMRGFLNYKIEHAGVKVLRVKLPPNAAGVRFSGNYIEESHAVSGHSGTWSISLRRRVMGEYRLEVSFQLAVSGDSFPDTIDGIRATDASLQRGYFALRSVGRLELRVPSHPSALQPIHWEDIPRGLRPEALDPAVLAFRALAPGFVLPLEVLRHQAVEVLPARVTEAELVSLVSESDEILTVARIRLHPGEKRHLRVKIPADSVFWYAFVNSRSALPWQEGNVFLIPLGERLESGNPSTVEFAYARSGNARSMRGSVLTLDGPKFDLPLEDIEWRVFLPGHLRLAGYDGDLVKKRENAAFPTGYGFNIEAYLSSERTHLAANIERAEEMMSAGNDMAAQGNQRAARDALKSAYSLSRHDEAFNEDARVQLSNLITHQAVVGLALRRDKLKREFASDPERSVAALPGGGEALNFTPQQAQAIMGGIPVGEEAGLTRLAERIVRQHAAVIDSPGSIRANVPLRGREYTFTRSLQVDPWRDLALVLKTREKIEWTARLPFSLGAAILFFAVAVGRALYSMPRREADSQHNEGGPIRQVVR